MSLAEISFEEAGRLTIPALLDRRVAETPDAVAVVSPDGSLTFGDWLREAMDISWALRGHTGVAAGDRVVVWISKGDAHSFVSSFQGALHAGAVAVPLDDRISAHDLQGILDETTARAIVMSPRLVARLTVNGQRELGVPESFAEMHPDSAVMVPVENGRLLFEHIYDIGSEVTLVSRDDAPVARRPDDCAFLGFTSGSTGRPKGVMISHGGAVQLAERMKNAVFALPRGGRPVTSVDIIQSPIPCYLTTSVVNNLYPSVLAGCPLVYEGRRFDPVSSESLMTEQGTTIYNGAPVHYARICGSPSIVDGPQPDVEVMIMSGSPLTRELYMEIRKRWPRTAVANWYALNETLTGQTINVGSTLEANPSAVGIPVAPTELRIIDEHDADTPAGEEGEILMRAEGQMLGYFGREEESKLSISEGWIRTGDRGYLDSDGLLNLSGRNKERINRGAFKFFPNEVESVLEGHPLVVEAAVIGVPHAELGQDVVSFVVLRESSDNADRDEAELKEFCRERLARHKIPARIIAIERLPRGDYGKVKRTELLQQFLAMSSVDTGSES
jgi:acyl-CoA synthetase (AMP-forming)/AMP-acid ligase II